jgi:hypothetical protein
VAATGEIVSAEMSTGRDRLLVVCAVKEAGNCVMNDGTKEKTCENNPVASDASDTGGGCVDTDDSEADVSVNMFSCFRLLETRHTHYNYYSFID